MPDLRLALAQKLSTRDGSLAKDALMKNLYREENGDKVEAIKRPGTSFLKAGAGKGQGTFNLGASSYSISGDRIQGIDNPVNQAIPGVTAFDLYYDVVSNVTFRESTVAVLKSTRGMWVFDGSILTQVVDEDYPTVTVRGLVLVDGTYYVMDAGGTISGSELEDPTSWNALNFIGTDQTLGEGKRIFRHLNYAFAFSDLGLQAFYDNNNPPPGSPLSPAGNATYLIGCASEESLVPLDDLAIFMSKAKQRGRSISALQGLSLVTLSTPNIDKILNRSNLSEVHSFGLKVGGHSFYLLTLVDLNLTLVLDLVAKDWAVWTFGTAESYFPFHAYLNGYYLQDILQHSVTGAIYRISPDFLTDGTNNIVCRVRTVQYDGQSALEKFFTALNLITEQGSSSVFIRYSDDDYATWNDWREVYLGNDRKQLRSLGKSRRRAFELQHAAPTTLRLEAIEFELYLGMS